jgi:hypothetical protein
MSSAPVAGAAFERYQQRGGGGAAAANGNTVRAFARFFAWVPRVAGGLVRFSYPVLMGISLPHFAYRWVPGAGYLAC